MSTPSPTSSTASTTVVGAGTYDYIDTGTIGTDAIKLAIIYKPAAVSPVGSYAILDSSVDPRFIDTKSRPVLAQTFVENATGSVFTVAVNHLKSKGSPCDDVGDPDAGDGSGNCNGTRTAAAEALVDWLATDPTGQRRRRLPDHRRPQLLRQGDPDRRHQGRRRRHERHQRRLRRPGLRLPRRGRLLATCSTARSATSTMGWPTAPCSIRSPASRSGTSTPTSPI